MFSIYRDQTALISLNASWEAADAAFRDAILSASRALDQVLQKEPHEQGESRDGVARVAFAAPLGVEFEVDEARKLVRILRAWVYRRAVN